MGVVGGRYRLLERLGTGGMSVVWRGHDEILGRPVAIKVLSRELAADRWFRARLRQEALAAAGLCHPNITSVFDFGFDEKLAVPYVVMELNDGEPVSARLRREGALPWRAAVTIVAEVASALAAAHHRGIVHRDVTPANVMLTGSGAKVVDFGISAAAGQRDAAPDGSLLGTPAYLAPERLGGGPVAPPADVYALGLLLYRCLTGRLPWPAGTTAEALRAHLYADPEPVPSLPGMPLTVAALCLQCLSKEPAERPTANALATALAAVAGARAKPLPSRPRPPALPGFGARLCAAVIAARHRMHAAVVTVVLIAALGLTWTTSQENEDVGTAQAAAAGTGVPHGGAGCKVRYRVQRDTGTDFGAQVTVINMGEHALTAWRLAFTFTGGQRLTGATKRIAQKGRRVVIRPKSTRKLIPGRSATVTINGSYRTTNPLPLTFTLNGHQCQVELLGAVVVPTSPPASPASPSSPSSPRKKPQKKSPPVKGRSGFSVAI